MKKVEVTDSNATPVRELSLPTTRESHLADSSLMRLFLQLTHTSTNLQEATRRTSAREAIDEASTG